MQVAEGTEIVRYLDLGDGNLQVQLAINGKLAPMIDDHKSTRERFPKDEDYFRYMRRQSEVLIHLFGDAQNPLSVSEIAKRQEEAF